MEKKNEHALEILLKRIAENFVENIETPFEEKMDSLNTLTEKEFSEDEDDRYTMAKENTSIDNTPIDNTPINPNLVRVRKKGPLLSRKIIFDT